MTFWIALFFNYTRLGRLKIQFSRPAARPTMVGAQRCPIRPSVRCEGVFTLSRYHMRVLLCTIYALWDPSESGGERPLLYYIS